MDVDAPATLYHIISERSYRIGDLAMTQ